MKVKIVMKVIYWALQGDFKVTCGKDGSLAN